jgi:hypothetical protein
MTNDERPNDESYFVIGSFVIRHSRAAGQTITAVAPIM